MLYSTLAQLMPRRKRVFATTTPPSMQCRGRFRCSVTLSATSPSPACSNTHSPQQQHDQDRRARGGRCGQQQGQGQQGQPISGSHGTNNGSGSGGGYYQIGSRNFDGGGSYANSGGGSYPTPSTSQAPPSLVKRFKNWNYCHTHEGDIHYTHTSVTCAQPGEHHQ